jgi:hypothetical protein
MNQGIRGFSVEFWAMLASKRLPTSSWPTAIDATTGALASIGSIAAGTSPYLRSPMDPAGNFVYVATENATPGSAGSFSMYAINATTRP